MLRGRVSDLQFKRSGAPDKIAFAFVALAHLLAIFVFTTGGHRREKDASVWSAPVLVILAPKLQAARPLPRAQPPRPTAPEPIRIPNRSTVQAEPDKEPADASEIAAEVPDSLIVSEPAPAVDLVLQAKRDLVKVERELARTQRPGINGPPTYQSALAKGIEAAHKPRGITIKEYILPDGRRMSRVGSKCHAALDNHTIMADAYRSQGRVSKEVPCPPN